MVDNGDVLLNVELWWAASFCVGMIEMKLKTAVIDLVEKGSRWVGWIECVVGGGDDGVCGRVIKNLTVTLVVISEEDGFDGLTVEGLLGTTRVVFFDVCDGEKW